MTDKHAILIAVENYSDPNVPPVPYARADAEAMRDALELHGFDCETLADGTATKTAVESRVKTKLSSLADDETLYLYYAGHGFNSSNTNYITCHDTQRNDLEDTSISLGWLLDQMNQSACPKQVLFLDSCSSGVPVDPSMRSLISDLDEAELRRFFEAAEHCVCFAACKQGEKSHSTPVLKHGVWTHHLVEALRGDAPSALERKTLVTSSSLQDHLLASVKKSLRTHMTSLVKQTPWMCGGMTSTFLVADVTKILEARRATKKAKSDAFRQAFLRGLESGRVRSLSGFKKTHRVPDDVTPRTKDFVREIAASEIDDDMQKVHTAVKDAFGFTRREMELVGKPTDGSQELLTPRFSYVVSVELSEDDPTEYVLERVVNRIDGADLVASDEFEDAFGSTFETVVIEPGSPIEVEEVIDAIEAEKDPGVSVSYPAGCEYCEIELSGVQAEIRVTDSTIEITYRKARTPKALLTEFTTVMGLLGASEARKSLPLD